MAKIGGGVLLVVALLVSACSNNPPAMKIVSGIVTKVHDGDSIHITPAGKKRVIIRLAGIDAPELAQPYGMASRDKLRSMILKKRAEAHCHKQDRYQREVCVVFHSEVDVNVQMLKSGLAWHYKQYEKEQTSQQRKAYARAERDAKTKSLGLWAGNSVAPWEFRRVN